MSVLAELERIAEQQDRLATFALLRRLIDSGEMERERIVDTLGRLSDPRAVAMLAEIGRDRTRPVELRRAALRVLEDAAMCPEGPRLRAWWESGDDVVRACVLRQATRGEADLVEPVVRDPSHRLYREALTGITFGFEEPHWQQYKIAGLGHSDPAVRRIAAESLGWDEPLAAEPFLHRASNDSDTDTACAAIDTLRYYPSRATLRLLHEIGRGDDARAAAAEAAEADLLDDFLDQRSRIGDWLAPVADLLGAPDPDTTRAFSPPGTAQPKPAVPTAATFITMYSDLDGPWAAKLAALHDYDWGTVPAADRPGLAAFLSNHPDPWVRDLCCAALSTWQEVDALLALAHDPVLVVRKSAVYYLRFVPPSTEIASLTWDLIASGAVAGTRGCEALATYAAHAPAGELDDRLIELARTDRRESVRAEAVSLLNLNVEPLLPLLSEPPLLTWAVHIRLLAACRELDVQPPAAETLRSVDNLHMAAALADLRH
ncbi:HEAT repeat domain-containing protein [Nocardia otitidiscaviarum]|uniref:HEAT repeat domain-containing protein n=1 Tax=Nocardia otitidiscaviarum TaxID=1823 RepID=UPI002453FFB6|nr:HEAT repeat domain-containing protein [Nocardia otitidiscaviarum]